MNFFEQLNKFLDEGYKLTDYSCPICKKSVVYNPTDKSLLCISCNLPVKFEGELIDDSEEKKADSKESSGKLDSQQEYEVINEKKQQEKEQVQEQKQPEQQKPKSDDYSKKLANKLLQGWAMLEECCAHCLIPIMRSKSGEHMCVGCGWSRMIDPKSGKSLQQFLLDEQYQEDEKEKQKQEQLEKEKAEKERIEKEKLEEQKLQQKLKEQDELLQKQQQLQQQQLQQQSFQQVPQQQPVQQQQVYQPVQTSYTAPQQSELKGILSGTLCRVAQYYDQQIQQHIQNNNISQVQYVTNNNLKELIELSKLLEKQSI